MIIYEYYIDTNKNIYCNPLEVKERPSSFIAKRWQTYSFRSVFYLYEEGLVLESKADTGNDIDKWIFLIERDDEKARQIFIDYYNNIINELNTKIKTHKQTIKTISNIKIEDKPKS